MTPRELFNIWAPLESVWSSWVAPVLFSEIDCSAMTGEMSRVLPEPSFARTLSVNIGLVLDLPGVESLEIGMALLKSGYRPVPGFNVAPGPAEITSLGLIPSPTNTALDVVPIQQLLCQGAEIVKNANLKYDAPPAFLLDANRLTGTGDRTSGVFDNRWMVFPQDFPAANVLRDRGIDTILLVQRGRAQPQEDFAYTLLQWQRHGIRVLSQDLDDQNDPLAIVVKSPPRLRGAWHRALAMLGFRRSSGGGFGSFFPDTTGAG